MLDNKNDIVNLEEVIDTPGLFFNVSAYPHFQKEYGARDISYNSKRYLMVDHLPSEIDLGITSYDGYKQVKFRPVEFSNGQSGYLAEIPEDSIFLGGVDLSDQGVGEDLAQHLWKIREIVIAIRKKGISDWEKHNHVALPLAFSPSTQTVYGISLGLPTGDDYFNG